MEVTFGAIFDLSGSTEPLKLIRALPRWNAAWRRLQTPHLAAQTKQMVALSNFNANDADDSV